MPRITLPVLLLPLLLTAPWVLNASGVQLAAAEDAAEKKKVDPVGVIVHDLRDFLPTAESTTGKDDDAQMAFSVKDGGTWAKYRSYNKNGTGGLSRTEIKAIVADLIVALRTNYPDTYSTIDSDGNDTITNAKLQAYLSSRH